MPVYLFTFHAYRSWSPDRPQGFVQRGRRIQYPNLELARQYRERAAQPAAEFDAFCQQVLVWISYDACVPRDWRLHCVATEPSHVHILVSWRRRQPWKEVGARIKNVASLMLGRKCNRPGRKWFTRKGSRKRVRDRRHLDYLMQQYLPEHSGLCWREGDRPPKEPEVRRS